MDFVSDGLHAVERQKIEEQLQTEAQVLREKLHHLGQAGDVLNLVSATSELSVYDNHPADIGSEMFERSKDISLRENLAQALTGVEAALARLADGTYGRCVHCGKYIARERLAALPDTAFCLECQSAREAAEAPTRPVEEMVVSEHWDTEAEPPFSFGTSDTGQDKQPEMENE